jgi:4-carboxymuconolactone decarboxylase
VSPCEVSYGSPSTNGVTKDEIVELFVHLAAYAGAATAFDSYQVALEVFAESST